MSEKFDITKIKNGNEYFDKNIIIDENDIMHNKIENVKNRSLRIMKR